MCAYNQYAVRFHTTAPHITKDTHPRIFIMGNAWSTLTTSGLSCPYSNGLCISLPRGVFIVSTFYFGFRLCVYSLEDKSLVRIIGDSGPGKEQFNFEYGGLCVSPDGECVLVAEEGNQRVQQLRIADGSWVRFAGEGVLKSPQYLDCNTDVIVVSESCQHRISVLSWADGSLRAQFGGRGISPGRLLGPCGIRLLASGDELVVADSHNDRLCVFTLSGEFVEAVGSAEHGLNRPNDVLECVPAGRFTVANTDSRHRLVRLNRDGSDVEMFGDNGVVTRTLNGPSVLALNGPSVLAALPDGGMAVLEFESRRFVMVGEMKLRREWVTACVVLSTREWRADDGVKRARVTPGEC